MIIGEYKTKENYTVLISAGSLYPLININILDCLGLTVTSFMMSQDMIKEFFNDVDHCISEADSFIFKIPYNGIRDMMINLVYNDEDKIVIRLAETDGICINPIIMMNTDTEHLKLLSAQIENDIHDKYNFYNDYIQYIW